MGTPRQGPHHDCYYHDYSNTTQLHFVDINFAAAVYKIKSGIPSQIDYFELHQKDKRIVRIFLVTLNRLGEF